MGSAKNYGDKTARQLRLILPRKSAFAALRSDKPPSKLKCEQRLRFWQDAPEGVYLCTRSGFVSLRRDKLKERCSQGLKICHNFACVKKHKLSPSKLKCEQRLRFCKADKRGSIPLYVTERFAAAKASRFAAILLASKTKAHVEVETQAVFYVVLVV